MKLEMALEEGYPSGRPLDAQQGVKCTIERGGSKQQTVLENMHLQLVWWREERRKGGSAKTREIKKRKAATNGYH